MVYTSYPRICVLVDLARLNPSQTAQKHQIWSKITAVVVQIKCAGEMRGRLAIRSPRVPVALRFHVPQHIAWILPCALLSSVESTAQANRE